MSQAHVLVILPALKPFSDTIKYNCLAAEIDMVVLPGTNYFTMNSTTDKNDIANWVMIYTYLLSLKKVFFFYF